LKKLKGILTFVINIGEYIKKTLLVFFALTSFSAFAQLSVLDKVVGIIADYTPFSPTAIVSSESSLNRPILNNYVAGAFYGNLNNDLKNEFGRCAHLALWDKVEITLVQLSEAIEMRCSL
jgi:hypothetical protein